MNQDEINANIVKDLLVKIIKINRQHVAAEIKHDNIETSIIRAPVISSDSKQLTLYLGKKSYCDRIANLIPSCTIENLSIKINKLLLFNPNLNKTEEDPLDYKETLKAKKLKDIIDFLNNIKKTSCHPFTGEIKRTWQESGKNFLGTKVPEGISSIYNIIKEVPTEKIGIETALKNESLQTQLLNAFMAVLNKLAEKILPHQDWLFSTNSRQPKTSCFYVDLLNDSINIIASWHEAITLYRYNNSLSLLHKTFIEQKSP